MNKPLGSDRPSANDPDARTPFAEGSASANSSAADMVWAYLTSVKQLRRRDGRIDDFAPKKIEASLWAAFRSAGLTADADRETAQRITQDVLKRLTAAFDGHTVPSIFDLREVIATTLLEQHLEHVSRQYFGFQKNIPMNNEEKWNVEESFSRTDNRPPSVNPVQPPNAPRRHRLNEERKAITHKFQIGTHEGYLTVGLYDDTRQPGEIFLRMSKEGSVMSGLVDAFATSISIGLQYGVPLKVFVNKFANMRFEPSGVTQNPNVPNAKSIVDYVFRWLALKFLTPEERQTVGIFADGPAVAAPQALETHAQPKLIDPAGFDAGRME